MLYLLQAYSNLALRHSAHALPSLGPQTEETPDAAIGALARVLYETMERLDPIDDEPATWEALSERDRTYYRLCVRELGTRPDLLRRLADDDVVEGHPDW